jgi:hypothetical protein
MTDEQANAGRNGLWYLLGLSFFSLFLELALIRWIGVEIRVFAYFRNLTLISCFLGLGIGFILKRYRVSLVFSLVLITVLTAIIHPRAQLFGYGFRNIPLLLHFTEFNVWQTSTNPYTVFRMAAGYSLISIVIVILAGIFIPFGQVLAQLFAAAQDRIKAYSINLLGSLAGIWVFALISYFYTPPWLWFLIAAGGMTLCIRPRNRNAIAGLALMVPILLLTAHEDTETTLTFWSPYQKIQLTKMLDNSGPETIPFHKVEVNTAGYMLILDLSPEQFKRFPQTFRPEEAPYYPYDFPYRFIDPPREVLVVGAGGGNDVAAAIRNGAGHVDAVEIDPIIARLGKLYNAEAPYQDPRVTLVVDDARSFFKKTNKHYDLIVFALLDSHTLISNFTNINLDSYVYTRESLEEAKSLLSERGVISLSFFVERDREWIEAKLYAIVAEVFGRKPLIINNYNPRQVLGTGGVLFLCGDLDGVHRRIEADPELARAVSRRVISPDRYEPYFQQHLVSVPSDDWPYLYLKTRQVPLLYYILTALLVGMMLLALRFFFPGRRLGPSHFFFLGAGFMLVEVHSISKAALLFGSTWLVNAVIISAILIMILVANQLVVRFRLERMRWWYAGLFISLVLSYLLPVDKLIVGNYLTRGFIAGAFYSLPMFFAGVIFARSLDLTRGVEEAFAANMIGSTVGGMLESASFLFGLRAVILIAMVLYLLSAWGLKRLPLREPRA